MPGVMPRTGGRAAGEGGQNPTGAVDAVQAQDRWSHLPGKPYALKGACAVWGGTVGNVPQGNALAVYSRGNAQIPLAGRKQVNAWIELIGVSSHNVITPRRSPTSRISVQVVVGPARPNVV